MNFGRVQRCCCFLYLEAFINIFSSQLFTTTDSQIHSSSSLQNWPPTFDTTWFSAFFFLHFLDKSFPGSNLSKNQSLWSGSPSLFPQGSEEEVFCGWEAPFLIWFGTQCWGLNPVWCDLSPLSCGSLAGKAEHLACAPHVLKSSIEVEKRLWGCWTLWLPALGRPSI